MPADMGRLKDNGSSSGSATMTIELPKYPPSLKHVAPFIDDTPNAQNKHQTTDQTSLDFYDAALPSPTTANTTPRLQKWNDGINKWRVLATFWCFLILGLNDAAYGALIPYLEVYYDVDYTTISLVFLSPVVGYVTSALTNNTIHVHFGQRGVAFMMSVSHLVAYILISLHPPYPALVVVFILAGFGNGLGDSAWNAWIGDMANPNEVLGFLHGIYGLGAAISPLVATAVITRAGWQWYEFYYFLIGAAAIEVVFLTGTFWKATAAVYREQHATTAAVHNSGASTPIEQLPQPEKIQAPWLQKLNPFHDNFIMNQPVKPSNQSKGSPGRISKAIRNLKPFRNASGATAAAVKNRVTVLTALFLLFYVGAEVSIGGWIVTFMLRVRHGADFASGIVATGFWLGVTVGRFVLGFVTARCFPTEKHAVAFYLIISVVLQLLFWLVPSFAVSAVMVALLGFFIAPLFPAAVVALTKLLPKQLHVAAVGFAAAVGASGATILPFAVGAIANSKGVQVLQPIVLALLVVITLVWLCIPKLPKQRMA